MYNAQDVQAYLNEHFDEIVDCRHHLHQYPEIGLELPQTAAYIESELKKYGVDEIHKDFGCSALLAVIHGKTKSEKWIGIRADMDALPLKEESGLQYASVNENRAHSCGHDGHMSVALAVCRFLCANRDFEGTVAVIFQPGRLSFSRGKRAMPVRESWLKRVYLRNIRSQKFMRRTVSRHLMSEPLVWMRAISWLQPTFLQLMSREEGDTARDRKVPLTVCWLLLRL